MAKEKRYCEVCRRLRDDIQWREDTKKYECEECYQWYLDHLGTIMGIS